MASNRAVRALPWILATVAAVVAVVLWWGRTDGGEQPQTPHRASSRPDDERVLRPSERGRQLRLLQRCMTRLVASEAAASRCYGAEAEGPSPRHLSPQAQRCLASPQIRKLIEAEVAVELGRRVVSQRTRKSARRIKHEALVTRWLERNIGLSPQQSKWVSEYVCAVRDLRGQALPDPSSAEKMKPYTWEELRKERDKMLTDLSSLMGAAEYKKLRAVGGIGLLADTINCE